MQHLVSRITDRLGLGAGYLLEPLVGLGTILRRGRLFHPRGLVLEGYVEPLVITGPAREVAERLTGPVIVRFSGAWWRQREWLDILGCSLRFRSHMGPHAAQEPDDQDLLFATMRHPVTTLLAPLTTRQHDALDNIYYGASPFRVPPLGRVWFRLVPHGPPSASGETREARLLKRVHEKPVELDLIVSDKSGHETPLVRVVLTHALRIDPRTLCFDPFRTGRDLHPTGFVQHMRKATYRTAQRIRMQRLKRTERARTGGALGPELRL